MNEWPLARAGQPLTPAMWNAARAAARANTLREGVGIRLKSSPDGTVISAEDQSTPWNHPFRVTLAGNSAAQFSPGFVNLVEPVIEAVPLSGNDDAGEPPPTLRWKKLALDADSRGYFAIECALDHNWKLLAGKATMLQIAALDTEDGKPGRTAINSAAGGVPILSGRRFRIPVAMLRMRQSGALDVIQILQGDVQFRAQPQTAATGRVFYW